VELKAGLSMLSVMIFFSFFSFGSLRSQNPSNQKLVTNSSPKPGYFWSISDQPEKRDRQRDLAAVPHN
jgi:hypothetical protein